MRFNKYTDVRERVSRKCWTHSFIVTESAAIFASLLLDNHLIWRIILTNRILSLPKEYMRITYQFKNVQTFAIHMEYYLCLLTKHKFIQSILLGEESIQIFLKIYSASHVSTFILCSSKITYAVALSMLLMTPWWLLDWYSGLQEFPNTNES